MGGRRRAAVSEQAIARRLRQGRGSGEGASYAPWLTIREVPSAGRRHRVLGRLSGRVHHLMSDLERRVFLEHDWRDDVVDVREQVALDRDVTRRIAAGLGYKHPSHRGVDVVMTTDLVVTVFAAGGRKLIPIHCKYAADLLKERARQKLEVETRYWEIKGGALVVATEADYPKARAEALQWLHAYHDLERRPGIDARRWRDRGAELVDVLRRCPGETPIAQVVAGLEGSGRFAVGEVLTLIRYLASHKRIGIRLDATFDVRWLLASVELPDR